MRKLTYAMSVSLDGYVVDPGGGFDWAVPSEELFRFYIDEIRKVGVHLLDRRLYETMLYWEDPEQAKTFDEAEKEWAALWNPLPKVVFSTTLPEVQGSDRLASGSLAEEPHTLPARSDARASRSSRTGLSTRGPSFSATGWPDKASAMIPFPVTC